MQYMPIHMTQSRARAEPVSHSSPMARVQDLLSSGHVAWWAALLAAMLALPGMRYGLTTDDEIFLQAVRSQAANPLLLFTSQRAVVEDALQQGWFSWWTTPQLSMHFFRPLSSLSHYVEYRFWPDAAWLMRAINALI